MSDLKEWMNPLLSAENRVLIADGEIATLRSQLAAAETRADRLADALRMIADGRVLSRSFTHAEVVAAYQKHARAALAEGDAG